MFLELYLEGPKPYLIGLLIIVIFISLWVFFNPTKYLERRYRGTIRQNIREYTKSSIIFTKIGALICIAIAIGLIIYMVSAPWTI